MADQQFRNAACLVSEGWWGSRQSKGKLVNEPHLATDIRTRHPEGDYHPAERTPFTQSPR